MPVQEDVELVKQFLQTFLKEQTLANTPKKLIAQDIKIPKNAKLTKYLRDLSE